MPSFQTKIPTVRFSKPIEVNWDNFRRGLNILLKETEVKGDELTQADNLMLLGKGVPTKRWGYTNYFLSNSTGAVRGLQGYYKSDNTNELVAITDEGTLTIKSGASYTQRVGASWASGYNSEIVQLDNSLYIVHPQRELVRYSTPTLSSFPTIATPTGVLVTQVSGASGVNTYSYRVSSVSNVGETLASTSQTISLQPQDLNSGALKISWSAVSTATGVLKGYNLYGRTEADERWLAFINSTSTSYVDDGSAVAAEFTFPPTADSTGGVKAKYIERFEDRLIYGGIDGEPTKVIISGRVPNQEKIDLSYGGNYVRIEPDAGDPVTGIKAFRNKIIIFKERSIWELTLSTTTVGNFTVTIPNIQLLTASHGCIAPRSIQAVENDLFFLSRDGVYTLGDEPNVLNVLRTNEISARIRPAFDNYTIAQKEAACSFYYRFQYGLAFPGTDKCYIYDRERLAWMGPWTFDSNIFNTYYDSNNDSHLVAGRDDSAYVIDVASTYKDDANTAIATTLRTRKEDFNDWSLFKTIKDIFFNFRNVTGSVAVNVRLEERSGNVITAKSFNIETVAGSSGWGADLWGNTMWGDSEETGGGSDLNDLVKWLTLNRAARAIQFEIKTTNRNDNYELLAIRSIAKPISRGFTPSSWKVS